MMRSIDAGRGAHTSPAKKCAVIIECRFVVKLVQWDEKCLTSVAVTDDRSNDGQPLLIGVEVEALTP